MSRHCELLGTKQSQSPLPGISLCSTELMMKNRNFSINTLSKHLFWDADIAEIDEQKHAKYIISKVLQYGLYSDWEKIVKFYKLGKIVDYAVKIRGLDKRTASFLSLISGIPKENFLCYTKEQSIPKHWNF